MRHGGTATLFAIPVFLLVCTVVAILRKPPPWVAALYDVVASAAPFIAYAVDKSAAARGDRRTPENSLHLLRLAGGSSREPEAVDILI